MKRHAIVLKASVNEFLPTYGNKYEKERDVWFSILACYKNNIFKCFRVPISPDADSVDISFLQTTLPKKQKLKLIMFYLRMNQF